MDAALVSILEQAFASTPSKALCLYNTTATEALNCLSDL